MALKARFIEWAANDAVGGDSFSLAGTAAAALARHYEKLAVWETSDCRESGEGRGFRYVFDLLKGAKRPMEYDFQKLYDAAHAARKAFLEGREADPEDKARGDAMDAADNALFDSIAGSVGDVALKLRYLLV